MKLLWLGILLIWSPCLWAQYTVSTFNLPYTELPNETVVNINGEKIDGHDSRVTLYGFPFTLFDTVFNQVEIRANAIQFFNLDTFDIGGTLETEENPFYGAISFAEILADKGEEISVSKLSYELAGQSEQETLTVQWKNVGIAKQLEKTDDLNFQLRFYKADNSIEIHFGNCTLSEGKAGLYWFTYFFDWASETVIQSNALNGDPLAPSIVENSTLNTLPPSGTVIRLSNLYTGRKNIETRPFIIYPNPCFSELHFSKKMSTIELFDSKGVQIQSTFNTDNIQTTDLPKGIYFVKMQTPNSVYFDKIIKE